MLPHRGHKVSRFIRQHPVATDSASDQRFHPEAAGEAGSLTSKPTELQLELHRPTSTVSIARFFAVQHGAQHCLLFPVGNAPPPSMRRQTPGPGPFQSGEPPLAAGRLTPVAGPGGAPDGIVASGIVASETVHRQPTQLPKTRGYTAGSVRLKTGFGWSSAA